MPDDNPLEEAGPTDRAALHAMARIHTGLVMGRRARILSERIAAILPKSAQVLDIGAGNGELSRAIMNLRHDVTIDGVDTMLWPDRHIDVKEFDGLAIPHERDAYDVCLASDVLHHAEEPTVLLAEMVRVARCGVVIKDHVADSRLDFSTLKFMDWFGNRGYGVPLPYRYWSWQAWLDVFDRFGLELKSLERYLGLYPFPLSTVFDRRLHFVAYLEIRRREM